METISKPPNDKARVRSAGYPAFTIKACISFTQRIYDEFSNVRYIPKDSISIALKQSGGTFLTLLSTSGQYGLLELKYGEGYKPTPLFKKIIQPLEGENVADSYLECIKTPPLYQRLLDEYKDSKLPSEVGLANMLDRNYEIKGDAAKKAARVFISNVTDLGLVSNEGKLIIDSYISFKDIPGADETEVIEQPHIGETASSPVLLTYAPEKKHEEPKTREVPIFLQGTGREAKVVLPLDFSDDDLKRIVKVLSAYIE